MKKLSLIFIFVVLLFSCKKDNIIKKDYIKGEKSCLKKWYHKNPPFLSDSMYMTCNIIDWRTTTGFLNTYYFLTNDTIIINGMSCFFDIEIWHFYPGYDSFLQRRIMWGTDYYYKWYRFY